MKNVDFVQLFQSEGFVVVPQLFSPSEVEAIKAHFMSLNKQGHGYEGDRASLLGDDDPLKAYPRMVHPHRFDQLSLDWLLDARLRKLHDCLARARALRGANHVLFQAATRARASATSRSAFTARAAWHLSGRLDGG